MKLHLTFEKTDFELPGSKFDDAVYRQLGNDVYVGTNSLVMYCRFVPSVNHFFTNPPTENVSVKAGHLSLTFKPSDFSSLRDFDSAVKRQLNKMVYVDRHYVALYFDYPKELVDMLRPYPPKEQLEFDLESSVTEAR